MHIKTSQAVLLTIALTLTVLLSNLSLGLNTQENTANQTSLPSGLTITQHKITMQELQQLSSRVISEQENQTQKVNGHGTGLTGLTAQDLEEIAQDTQVIDNISYQAGTSYDNSATQYFPPIGNQDGVGSCVAWAVGYYTKTYQEAKEHNWNLTGAAWEGGYYGHPSAAYQNRIISPQFIYSLVNGGVDDGTSFERAIRLTANIGVCSWQKMPYTTSDYTSWPSEAAWSEAPYYRSNKSASTYEYLYANNDAGITSLKNWLAAGNLAVIALDAYEYDNLSAQDLLASYTFDSSALNHANTIVGYDDNFAYNVSGVMHYGAFKVANSWGIGGSWENVADGFYWISYDAMKSLSNSQNPVIIFNDLINYQPEILAKFQITHNLRGECTITLGYGTPSHSVVTKAFNSYVYGGSQPFCLNNIVVDITEFKSSMTSLYNQPFYLSVYDSSTTSATGTVNYFAVQNAASADAPKATINSATVSLAVNCTLINPTLSVSPLIGNAGTQITLTGTGFTGGGTVNLAYLNPITSVWTQIATNVAVSASNNFTYTVNAPDLGAGNALGDNGQTSDAISFSAKDNSSNQTFTSNTTFAEYRKGLTLVGNAAATGVFGNNTDLSGRVAVQAGQSLVVSGRSFLQGTITAVYDGLYSMGSISVGQDGTFNGTLTIPNQAGPGKHNVTLGGVGCNFVFYITRLPLIVTNYDGNWHNSDFTVTLSPDGTGVSTIYYKINGGSTQTVGANGQPVITGESAANTLEYWGIWSSGETSIELTHNTLSTIKLDKTAPSGSLKINGGDEYCGNNTVALTVTAQDALSGLQQMRFSNDGTWDTEPWQPISSSSSWTLTAGDGQKTVWCQIMDNAGLTTSFQSSICLDTTKPVIESNGGSVNVAGSSIHLIANVSDQNGISTYTWNFGDSTSAQGQQVDHVYAQAGNYTVTLSVQDLAGNTASSTLTVNVEASSQSTPSSTATPTNASTPSTNSVIPEFSPDPLTLLTLFSLFLGFSLIIICSRRKLVPNKE